jgi:hypothetical protein
MKIKYFAFAFLVGSLLAQAKPAAEQQADKPFFANDTSQVAILKAEHALDQIVNAEQAMQRQFDQLQAAYKEQEVKRGPATKAVNDALDAVFAVNKVSKDDYNFDPASMQFSKKPPKPAAAQAEPAAKK